MYTANMIRRQIYIPEGLHKQVDQLAKMQGASFAEMVRMLLLQRLDEIRSHDNTGRGALRAITKIRASGGPTDLSELHDKYLYGTSNK